MEQLSMWDYWLEKRGRPSEALEADYPETLADSPELQEALAMVKAGELLIKEIMDAS